MATDEKSVGPSGPFTLKYLQALKPRDKRYEVTEPGRTNLRVLVEPSGTKTFYYVYKKAGRRRYVRLARFTTRTDLAGVRAKARHYQDLRDEKIDPRAAKLAAELAEKLESAAATTVKALVRRYIQHVKKHKRSWAEDDRILTKNVVKHWGERQVRAIERGDVKLLFEDIVARPAPIAANRTLACLRTMFNYAIDVDIVTLNPCKGVKMPAKERRRDRWLTDSEIKAFWSGLEACGIGLAPRVALQLMLVTGQRKGEVIGMTWSELDLDGAWWTIPAARAKNNNEHRVPLSPFAVDLLRQLPRMKRSPVVFPARGAKGHLRGSSVDHAIKNNRAKFKIDDEVIAPFTPHDLRRTVATNLAHLGIARVTISKILNHAEGGVTTIYDRHAYEREKRFALEAWATHLRLTLERETVSAETANIVALRS